MRPKHAVHSQLVVAPSAGWAYFSSCVTYEVLHVTARTMLNLLSVGDWRLAMFQVNSRANLSPI